MAALGYALAVLVATWPTCLHLGESLLGTSVGDLYLGIWGFWWYHRALAAGVSPLRGDLLDYPYGGVTFVADPLSSILSLPLQSLFPLPVAYNLLIMGHLLFAALATFALLRYLGVRGGPAFAGGIVYGFSALVLGYVHNGVSQQVSVGWLPLFALRFLMALRPEAGVRAQAIAGACLALGVMSSWYNAACLAMAVPFLLWPSLSSPRWRTALARGVRVAVLGAVLSTPFLLAQLWVLGDPRTLEARGAMPLKAVFQSQNGSDLARMVTAGEPSALMYRGYVHSTYLGLVALALALWGLARRWNEPAARAWAAMLAWFVVLAWGFFLEVDGRFLTLGGHLVPLPFLFLHRWLPGFAWLDFPHRFLLPGLLALACLAGWGLDDLRRLVRVPGPLLCGVFTLAVFVESVMMSGLPYPLTTTPARVPAFYERVGATTGSYGIVDLPTAVNGPKPVSKAYFYYQAVHGKGIPYDISATVNARLPGTFGRSAALRRLAQLGTTPGFSRRGVNGEGIAREVRALGYRYIVLHLDVASDADVMALRWLLDPVLPSPLEEDGVLVYDLEGRP